MSTSETIDTHGFDTHLARAYFAEYLEDPTLEFIEDTFEYDTDDLRETSEALLAAELVAAWIGSPAANLPANLAATCKGKNGPNKKLLLKTRTAVRAAIADDSALRAHWQEKGIEPWLGAVKNLLDRLT